MDPKQYIISVPSDKVNVIRSLCHHLGVPIERYHADVEAGPAGVTLRAIKETAAEVFGVSVAAMVSECRKSELVLARNVCYALAHEHLGMKDGAIGQAFSRRDRSTVTHGRGSIDDLIQTEPHLLEQAGRVEQALFVDASFVFV